MAGLWRGGNPSIASGQGPERRGLIRRRWLFNNQRWAFLPFLTGFFAISSCLVSWAASPTSLADAAEARDSALVSSLLQKDADPNTTQVDGMTALHWATHFDDTFTAQALVSAGANVIMTNRYGVTPLSLACGNGNAILVELFLDNGADPDTELRGGETALMTAARTGRPGAVKALLERGAEVDRKERHGQTAIMWAAAEGYSEVVKLLLDAGADARESLPNSGFNPFFFAARNGHAAVARILLASGVDVNEAMQVRRGGGKNPRDGMSALMLAVENGHFELAAELLQVGADPNDQRSEFTPLHAITWVRKPNRGDGPDGDPAPRGSGPMSSLQFVERLVASGADVNARLEKGQSGRGQLNHKGATPFLLAATTADVPLMRLLVELGADPLLGNADGCTPLMAAAGIGTMAPTEEAGTEAEAVEAVQFLLNLGADVNTVDARGETAMHGAAYKNLPAMVHLLADRGAAVEIWNHRNKYGWTPLLIAQGYRVGNYKPAPATETALREVMMAAGVQPPGPPAPGDAKSVDIYAPVKK